MLCWFLVFHLAHGISASPLLGPRMWKSTKGAGEVEGSGLGAAPRRSRDDELQPAHMSARYTSSHINTSHVSNPSRSISPLGHVIDKAAVIFSALVLSCLCHRPLCDHSPPPPPRPPPPRFSTLVAASLSAEQHGTVYISAKLALPFGPTLLHFRLLADAVIRGRQTGK